MGKGVVVVVEVVVVATFSVVNVVCVVGVTTPVDCVAHSSYMVETITQAQNIDRSNHHLFMYFSLSVF